MIHLHCHTAQGSWLDSTNTPKDLPKKAKELKMEAVAVTEHGYTSSHVDFYKACKEEEVKPILGCELYVCDDMNIQDSNSKYDHLVVIAKNKTGYKNLLKLSSLGFTKGFYYKPRVDMKTLKKYKEGLIVMTACLGGEIPRMILSGAYSRKYIENKVREYANIFKDFYLEIQPADNFEQKKVNKRLVEISQNVGIPLVATSDVHFLNKEDYELHGVFIQINQDRDNEVYQDCWFKTEKEVMSVLTGHVGFEHAIEAIANTHKIADKCNVEIELGNHYLPDYSIPETFKEEDEFLWHLIKIGFKERGIDRLPTDLQKRYWDRLKYEYDIITKKGFSGYFLIVRDIIKTCHENGIITGDGRGSADNSLVCYIIGITNVDSIKYDLNFSRFLTLERKSLPDIDMDIQASRKQELVNLLKDKWGHDRVAQICTYGTLQAKAILDAIGKVLYSSKEKPYNQLTYKRVTEIKKYIPDQTTLKEALKGNHKLQEYKQKYPKLFNYAVRLEGLPRNISVHAGGVVICPSNKDMTDFTAIALSKDKEEITQLEMHNVEEVGLVKMDCLGLKTLDIVADTLDLIDEDIDYLDVSTLDFEDSKTYGLVQKGLTDGVFQLESSGMKETCKRVKPESMEDIIAILALYRPDTMRELEHYIKRKHGEEEITYLHPDLKPILGKTYGTMIYQEQVMAITKTFAGYSDGEADGFRKGIGKKDKELVKKLAEDFRTKTLERKYSEDVTNTLADDLKAKGSYMFNKGHSSGYGILSYKTAYLKSNHPVEYMCSLMTNQQKDSGSIDYESIGLYMIKCEDMGIKVKNPDVNLSQPEFTPHDGSILYGLNLIKGVGSVAINEIIENRPFNSFEDFISKVGGSSAINKTVIVSLIKAGAFDFTGISRKELLKKYGEIRFEQCADSIKPLKSVNKNHIKQLLDNKIIKLNESSDKDYCLKAMNKWRALKHEKEWEKSVLAGNEYSWEFETLSYYIKGNPFKGYRLPAWDSYEEDFCRAKFFGTVVSIKKTKIKRGKSKGKTMAFIEFSTPEGMREGVVFSDAWNRLRDRLEKGSMVVVRGKKQGEKCLVNGALDFNIWKDKQAS